MADLHETFAEAVKLNRQITQFLKFSTYTDYDDLSGLDGIDRADGGADSSLGGASAHH